MQYFNFFFLWWFEEERDDTNLHKYVTSSRITKFCLNGSVLTACIPQLILLVKYKRSLSDCSSQSDDCFFLDLDSLMWTEKSGNVQWWVVCTYLVSRPMIDLTLTTWNILLLKESCLSHFKLSIDPTLSHSLLSVIILTTKMIMSRLYFCIFLN